MSEGQLFIGIDSGTQGTKAVVFSREQGKIIAEAYADHRIIETQEGRREQEPGWWIEASTAAIGKVLKEPTFLSSRFALSGCRDSSMEWWHSIWTAT